MRMLSTLQSMRRVLLIEFADEELQNCYHSWHRNSNLVYKFEDKDFLKLVLCCFILRTQTNHQLTLRSMLCYI